VGKRVILAATQREYVAKLADYVREQEPTWDVAAFTYAGALRLELQDLNRSVDLLVGEMDLLREAGEICDRARKSLALVDDTGTSSGAFSKISQFQPLPSLMNALRGVLEGDTGLAEGCRIVTVFSASGGTGKTTLALNLIRQAGERGLRTFYLNLEALNATSLWFGHGEPDSLSRLLYGLQAHPERWEDLFVGLCRHQPYLRTDYLDAPEHPGERLALTSELLANVLGRIRSSGRYDLIVVDPDQGAGEWHRSLLMLSDQVVWLTIDDLQGLMKAKKLLNYWRQQPDELEDKLAFVMNKVQSQRSMNRWSLPGEGPAMSLPYIPQWKTVDQPGRQLGAAAFCGAVDELLEMLGIRARTPSAKRRKEGEDRGVNRPHVRGAG
jgi:cellulose biosynthesis protein BcsQ